jgi:hypothetical protein
MAYKVFISSSYRDIDLAKDLAHRLEDTGVQVYSVDKAAAGDSIAAEISHGLSSADEVIVILTDNSVNNSTLMFEIGAATSLRKRVTPIIVGLEKQSLPSIIRTMKYVKYPDLPKYISELGRRAEAA